MVALGLGDARLGAFVGLVLGVPQVFLALTLAVLLGGLAAFLYWLVHAFILHRYTLFTTIPYSPYLVGGAMITMFFGPVVSPWLPGG